MQDYGRRLDTQKQRSQALATRATQQIAAIQSSAQTNLPGHLSHFTSQLHQSIQNSSNSLKSVQTRIQEKREKLRVCLEKLKEMQEKLSNSQGTGGASVDLIRLKAEAEEVRQRFVMKQNEFQENSDKCGKEIYPFLEEQQEILRKKLEEAKAKMMQTQAELERL